MGAFAAVVYSIDGLGHWESDAQSSALADTGLSTLAGTGWQQFPSWWSGMEQGTSDGYYEMGCSFDFCEERPMCQPSSAEFGLDCFPPMTQNVQVPSVAQRHNEREQRDSEKQEFQSRIEAEPDGFNKEHICSLSHSSNWKNTFVHIVGPSATMHGAQRRSRSVPKDLGASRTDWNATYQAFRFVRASISEQPMAADVSKMPSGLCGPASLSSPWQRVCAGLARMPPWQRICHANPHPSLADMQASSGAPETHIAVEQRPATELYRHAQEKDPSWNRRCDRAWKGHDAQRHCRSRQTACVGLSKADKWWPERRCDTWQSAVVPAAAATGAWEESDCWSSRDDPGYESGFWNSWQHQSGWRMRRIPRSWW